MSVPLCFFPFPIIDVQVLWRSTRFPLALHCHSDDHLVRGDHRPRWSEFDERIQLQGKLSCFALHLDTLLTPMQLYTHFVTVGFGRLLSSLL